MKQPKQKSAVESTLVKTAREIDEIRAKTKQLVENLQKANEIVIKAQVFGNEISEQIAELNHQEAVLTDKLGNL